MIHEDFEVKVLGNGTIKSPLKPSFQPEGLSFGFIGKDDRILFDASLEQFIHCQKTGEIPISFEQAGPHKLIYFDPAKTKVAIVTCGGLCPGLNNVIRSIVNQLYYQYNVKQTIGIRYGYEGFIPSYNHSVIDLTPQSVDNIHRYVRLNFLPKNVTKFVKLGVIDHTKLEQNTNGLMRQFNSGNKVIWK